jgi:hypothetical protein
MPTQEQMDRVTSELEILTGGLAVVCLEGDRIVTACPGRPSGYLFWDDLVGDHRRDALTTSIDWNGFSEAERSNVIQRVLNGEDKDRWMTSVILDQFISEKNIDGYLSWLGGDPEKTRDRLEQVEAYDSNRADVPDNSQVRPLTEQLITAVLLDAWPGRAAVVDFGIDSAEHLVALQFAIKFGEVTPQELDAAMGNGAKLTEIAQRGDNPYRDVTFHTSWDSMSLEPPEELGPDEAKALFAEIRADENAARLRDYGDAATPNTERVLFEKILHGPTTPEVKRRGPRNVSF